MSNVTIVTVTRGYGCMNHEQNWLRKGVFSCFKKATGIAVAWVEEQGQPEVSEFSNSDKLGRVFIQSRCGNFAASVVEVSVID